MSMKILAAIKIFDFSNYSTRSNYCDNSNKLVIGVTKDETVAIEEFVGLKPKMCSFLIQKYCCNIISHNEYKDALLNKKCFKTFNEQNSM